MKIPKKNEIRYITADSATNAVAYKKIQEVFGNNNSKQPLFDSVVGCYPFLWSELKNNPFFDKADGAVLMLNMCNNKVVIGKVIRHNKNLDSLQSFIVSSVKKDSSFIIRKLDKDELYTFWVLMPSPLELEEPLFIVQSKSRKLILSFKNNYVFQMEDISDSHKITPIPLDSAASLLPDLNDKSKK